MSKIVALQTDPTTEGSVITVPSSQPTLNGLPIATLGSKLLYKGSPGDQPAEAVAGVQLNGKPLTYVGAATVAGASILSAGNTTAVIEPAEGKEPVEPSKEDPEESLTVQLRSDYPMLQLKELATEVARSTFYLMMSGFFGDDIPIISYENLYLALKEKPDTLMPEIVVLSRGLEPEEKAAYNHKTKKIEIQEQVVRNCVEGEEEAMQKARADLLQYLLEEYGHYLDDILRNRFSATYGDAIDDEGAVYSYYFTNYRITDPEIDYAVATVDGVDTRLVIDLSSIQQDYEQIRDRVEADCKEQEREFFKSGKGDIQIKQYGHFDFSKRMSTLMNLNDLQLSWLYLGNYMRDMSQVVTPLTTHYTDSEYAEMDAVDPEVRGLFKHSFFEALKLKRKTWTKIVEVLAAHHTMKEIRPESIDALDNKNEEPRSNGKSKKDFIFEKAGNMGLKAAQLGLDYLNFITHFEGITPEELGVYRPEEHIDNPIYAAAYDNLSSPSSIYYCPPRKKEEGSRAPQTSPSIGDVYGMKRYIRNEENGIEKNTDKVDVAKGTGKYAGGNLPTAVACMKEFFRKGVHKYKTGTNSYSRNKGLSDIGAALHILEDYFAHTNFCEIALIKNGISVYPWVNFHDPELKKYGPEEKEFILRDFEEKNATFDESRGDLVEYSFFTDVNELYSTLSENGECILLPSFWFKGIYFTFRPKGGSKKLYRATAEGEVYLSETSDPLNLQCIDVRKKQVYGYRNLAIVLVNENTRLVVGDQKSYAAKIPVVSGYFAGEDSLHSLVDISEKMFEESQINFKSIFMTNDFKYSKGMQLMDMLVYHILTDLMLTQQEKGKSAEETGIDYSRLMEYYNELIGMREIIIGIAESARKKSGLVGIAIFLVERLVNTLYASVMNLIKSLVVEMLRSINHLIKDWQSMQITNDIGTNPSHSQLAKDEFHHPLHSLAGDLALHCTVEIGKDIQEMIENPKKEMEYFCDNMIKKAVGFMQHPSHTDWADSLVKEWIQGQPDKIEELHQEDYDFQKAEKLGKDVKEILAKLQETYSRLQQLSKEAYNRIVTLWEKLKVAFQEFMEKMEILFKKGKAYVKKMQKEMEEWYEKKCQDLQEDYEILKNKIENKILNLKDLLFSQQQVPQSVELHLAGLNFQRSLQQTLLEMEQWKGQLVDNTGNSDYSLQGQLMTYYEKNLQELRESLEPGQNFESRLYAYCYQDTADPGYRFFGNRMYEYYAFRREQLKNEEEYLKKSVEQQLAYADLRNQKSPFEPQDSSKSFFTGEEREYDSGQSGWG